MDAGGNEAKNTNGRAAHEKPERQLARWIILIFKAADINKSRLAHIRPQAEVSVRVYPVKALRWVEVVRPIHFLLRIRSDERCQRREKVKQRQQNTAGDRQRAFLHLRPKH